MSHVWYYYVKKTDREREKIVPIDEAKFLKLAEAGKIKTTTRIASPTRTKSEWVDASKVDRIKAKIVAGEKVREKKRHEQLELRREQQQFVLEQEQKAFEQVALDRLSQQQAPDYETKTPHLRKCLGCGQFQFTVSGRCRSRSCRDPVTTSCFSSRLLTAGPKGWFAKLLALFWKPKPPKVDFVVGEEIRSKVLIPFMQLIATKSNTKAGSGLFSEEHQMRSSQSQGSRHSKSAAWKMKYSPTELDMVAGTVRTQYDVDLFEHADARQIFHSTELSMELATFESRIDRVAKIRNCSLPEAYIEIGFGNEKWDEESKREWEAFERRFLPFLQQILAFKMEDVDEKNIVGQLKEIRERIRMESFEADLERQQGKSILVMIEMIDKMNANKFELFLGIVYETFGYTVLETPRAGDQGADIVIEKNEMRSVIQAIHGHSKSVSQAEVQEAFDAKKYFNCQQAIVITNGTFSKRAALLAKHGGIKMMGRRELKATLVKFNGVPKDPSRLAMFFG